MSENRSRVFQVQECSDSLQDFCHWFPVGQLQCEQNICIAKRQMKRWKVEISISWTITLWPTKHVYKNINSHDCTSLNTHNKFCLCTFAKRHEPCKRNRLVMYIVGSSLFGWNGPQTHSMVVFHFLVLIIGLMH